MKNVLLPGIIDWFYIDCNIEILLAKTHAHSHLRQKFNHFFLPFPYQQKELFYCR
jgi:hypothetical protein